MTEILFYHMTEATLEKTLPELLEKSTAKGWNCVVQTGDENRLEKIDKHLWTYRNNSFLPHSAEKDETKSFQPIWLTCDEENPNSSQIRFMVEGANPPNLENYERAVYLFDGHNEEALAQARERWKIEKDAGHEVTYWKQKPNGGWEKKA